MFSVSNCDSERVTSDVRISIEEQLEKGYSLAQQLEAPSTCASSEGYEILEEATNPAQSGETTERPGLDRMGELGEAGGASVALGQSTKRR